MNCANLIKVLLVLFFLSSSLQAKTIIIGFDGMDPKLAKQWMDSGDLQNFKKLADEGTFQSLGTTNPAQSPVAWSSFATGLNPGQHGIFDFIHRDPKTLEPVYSISGIKPPETFDFFGWNIPKSDSVIYNKRIGKPFWLTAEQYGHKTSVLRVPVTYPPDNNTRMLSGMGVPDLLGTQGTYTFYATKYIDKSSKGGNIVRVKVKNNKIVTTLDGPPSPFTESASSIPLILTPIQPESVGLNLDGVIIELHEGQWSDWVKVDFGLFSINGMVRFYLEEGFPRVKLYASPIHINPSSPVLPISNPPEFANQLSDDIGLFHTLGMPEETWSLNDGLIDSNTYLTMVKEILDEREKMFFNQLDDKSIDLLVEVFVQTDRVSHMFWHAFDPKHSGYLKSTELERNAIKWIYQEADRILGKTMSKLDVEDKLIVISDHGFAPYYKHVNLNRWLLNEGFLNLKQESVDIDIKITDIDWSKTQAYAMGLNGIYLNLKGREKNGIVEGSQNHLILSRLRNRLSALTDDGSKVISKIYNSKEVYSGSQTEYSPDLLIGYNRGYRASWQTVLGEASKDLFSINTDKWSGDHCIDPQLVPGVLFSNYKLNKENINIANVSELVMNTLKTDVLIIDKKFSGFLDIPRAFVETILDPIDKYLPSILGLILAGLLLGFTILLLYKASELIPQIIIVKQLAIVVLFMALLVSFLDAAKISFTSAKSQHDRLAVVHAIPIDSVNLPPLSWTTTNDENLIKIGHNKWKLKLDNITSKITLQESDKISVVEIQPGVSPFTKVQKRWWHAILSNKGGYLSKFSQIKKVSVYSDASNSYWLLWVILGTIIFFFGSALLKKLVRN